MFSMLNYCKFRNISQNGIRRRLDCSPIWWSTINKISSKPKNYYETLNLSKNCTSKEIRDAFIALSKQYHPDKNKGNLKAQEQFIRISEAYNVLIKPESRQDYDFSLKTFAEPSRVYKSGKKTDYYEVHRYDSHFRDPWKDPSFYKNRNFDEEDKNENYYGVKGLKKQTNDQIVFWILVFATVGLFLQISIIRFANANTKVFRDRQSEENRRHLEFVQDRAEYYGTLERQMEAFKKRAGITSESNKSDIERDQKEKTE